MQWLRVSIKGIVSKNSSDKAPVPEVANKAKVRFEKQETEEDFDASDQPCIQRCKTERLIACFRNIDTDCNGEISRAELVQLLKILDSEGTLPECAVDLVMEEMDPHHTGSIDYSKFAWWLQGGSSFAQGVMHVAQTMEVERQVAIPLVAFGPISLDTCRGARIRTTNTAGTAAGGIDHGIVLGKYEFEGVDMFTCTIQRSRSNDFEGMFIGVARLNDNSDPRLQEEQQNTPSGQCWMLSLFTWQVWCGLGPLTRPKLTSKGSALPGDNSWFTDPLGDGVKVEVLLDLTKGKLAFSVNDGEAIDSGFMLPGKVRPYVQMCFLDDEMHIEM